MAGALDGIRVIDFGQYIAGPLAGMLLADQGADVIKIDPPGGPRHNRLLTSSGLTINSGNSRHCSMVVSGKGISGERSGKPSFTATSSTFPTCVLESAIIHPPELMQVV